MEKEIYTSNQKTIEVIYQSLRKHPDDKQLRLHLIRLLESEGKIEDAIDEILYLMKDENPSYEVLFLAGKLYRKFGDYKTALEFLLALYEKQPKNPDILSELAWVYYEIGDMKKARKYYSLAEVISPKGVDKKLGELLYNKELPDLEVLDTYQEIVEVDGDEDGDEESPYIIYEELPADVFEYNGKYNVFDDIVGYRDIKEKLSLYLEGFKNPKAGNFGGIVILFGPPGVGKTLFQRAMAGEYRISLQDTAKIYTTQNVEDIFISDLVFFLEKNHPAMLLMDNIDKTMFAGDDEKVLLFSKLENMMDDINDILVVMTLTYPWQIKNAKEVIFSKWVRDVIYIPPPNWEDRKKLLSMFFQAKKIRCKEEYISLLSDRFKDATPFELRKVIEGISAYTHLYNDYRMLKNFRFDGDTFTDGLERFIGNIPMAYRVWKQELLKADDSSAINFLKEIVLDVEKNFK
jgi:AAA+ superfamily predicted ATPase